VLNISNRRRFNRRAGNPKEPPASACWLMLDEFPPPSARLDFFESR